MITLSKEGGFLLNGTDWVPDNSECAPRLAACGKQGINAETARKSTMAYSIMQAHNVDKSPDALRIKFDAMASHDITFVGIIQTARASGLEKFPVPYVLTNCHNTLCAVGGTINEDDHVFGLSAAKRYGGIYVPPHIAVIHQYMREMHAGCGKMILGSDSHTRYGALGTMAIGEGGGELAKQLLGKTYDVTMPEVVAVYLKGSLQHGVGPQDVALAIIGAVFKNGYVKNRVMEFVGPGIAALSVDTRNGIDVMTTETTCLSSIWCTDDKTRNWLSMHGRAQDYKPLAPGEVAYYNGCIEVDLDTVKPMIALPMHPSNVYEISELQNNLADILHKTEEDCRAITGGKISLNLKDKIVNGKLKVDQGVIAGCAGGIYENICAAASILGSSPVGNDEYALSVYPASQPVMMRLVENGIITKLMAAGATVRTAFCGPCFGAGDVPANGALSVRHTTRNFPNREGSKPSGGQIAGVALMDARSIAATSLNGGYLASASEIDYSEDIPEYSFDSTSYESRVYNGYGKASSNSPLKFGPNIKDWPTIAPLCENLVLSVAAFITDDVTTTDELIPSGETSSYRSNPLGLAEYTLSRKDPDYVKRAKVVQNEDLLRSENKADARLLEDLRKIDGFQNIESKDFAIASTIYAKKPGDGSAREQAASCQRVLGAGANIAVEYATKRYRSNLINWGMVPFQIDSKVPFTLCDKIFIPHLASQLKDGALEFDAYVLCKEPLKFTLKLAPLTADERKILLSGCLINYYKEY
ncbi:MAG: hydratase [Oscillospiraceae bacterium]